MGGGASKDDSPTDAVVDALYDLELSIKNMMYWVDKDNYGNASQSADEAFRLSARADYALEQARKNNPPGRALTIDGPKGPIDMMRTSIEDIAKQLGLRHYDSSENLLRLRNSYNQQPPPSRARRR